jgi:hypothetical protein
VTFWDEHFASLAETLKGDATCSLLVGVVTVRLANAGAELAASRHRTGVAFLRSFIADLQ